MKTIFFLLQIFLFTFITINAQSAFASRSASATAYLVVPLSIEATLGDLDFGDIILSGHNSIEVMEPTNGKLFVVSGHPWRFVTFTFNSVSLSNTSWVISSGGSVDNLEFVPDVELASGVKIHNGDNARLELDSGIGKLKVWVGGSVKISADQKPGNYTGRFTLNVSY